MKLRFKRIKDTDSESKEVNDRCRPETFNVYPTTVKEI